MPIAIQAEELGKLYRVDHTGSPARATELSSKVIDWVRSPLHKLRHGAASNIYSEDFWALDDVSFTINEGDVVGIIGRNGAGKSTLLKILSRITYPTTGRAVVYGRVRSLLEVGTGFHEDLTGRENVFLNGAILGMTRQQIRASFDDIVEFSGVSKFIDTPVKRYSSGMRVRLGFSVAAFLEPEILIVDEVLAVGDVEFQRRCLGKLSSVAESGRTVIFVSHNLFAMQQLTSRCLLLDQGNLLMDDATDAVVERYLRLYSADEKKEITREMHKKSEGARITQLLVLDEGGSETSAPKNFSPIRLTLRFLVERELSSMVVTVGIDTMDAKSLVRFVTPDDYFGDGPVSPGQYEISLGLTLPLHAATYTTFVRIDESERHASSVAILYGVVSFDLIESRALGLDSIRKPYQQSLLQLEPSWGDVNFTPT